MSMMSWICLFCLWLSLMIKFVFIYVSHSLLVDCLLCCRDEWMKYKQSCCIGDGNIFGQNVFQLDDCWQWSCKDMKPMSDPEDTVQFHTAMDRQPCKISLKSRYGCSDKSQPDKTMSTWQNNVTHHGQSHHWLYDNGQRKKDA